MDDVVHMERERMRGARLRLIDLTGARLEQVALNGAVMRGVELEGAVLDGSIEGLVINGVEAEPLIEAELDRRHPERLELRPTDPDGFRRAWEVITELWVPTMERAARTDPDLLHASVDGEWSFIQTLRHLLFATDAWIARAVLGDPSPWHPLDLPFDTLRDLPDVPNDRDARPSLEEVSALRAERMSVVADLVDGLTDEGLAATTEPVDAPGYPPANAYPVAACIHGIIWEEWFHRRYAERDLDALTAAG